MKLQPIQIEATSLTDAWFQAVYKCLEVGRDFKIDQGSYEGERRLEFDFITVHIKKPSSTEMYPQIPGHYNIPNPVEDGYIEDYVPYLMTGELKPGESYTYGSRLCKANCQRWGDKYYKDKNILKDDNFKDDRDICYAYVVDQIKSIIKTYKKSGHRNNQMILQVAEPSDIVLKDPPCLRHIDTRIQDGKLHFFPYFRSWDLWGGFPANLGGIQLLKEYMAAEMEVEDGEIIASSKGLHLYKYVWELAEIMRGKTIDQFRNGE